MKSDNQSHADRPHAQILSGPFTVSPVGSTLPIVARALGFTVAGGTIPGRQLFTRRPPDLSPHWQ